jgi:hypothetical protein
MTDLELKDLNGERKRIPPLFTRPLSREAGDNDRAKGIMPRARTFIL